MTAVGEHNYAGRMFLASLLLATQQPATSPQPRADLTYGFATERVEVEFDSPSSRLRWTGDQHDSDPARPASSLLLECSPSAPAVCVLHPIHVEGLLELFVGASARIPEACRLSIDVRTARDYDGKEGGAWVRAIDLGAAQLNELADGPAIPTTLTRVGGHVRMLAEEPYLQLRLTARTASTRPACIAVSRISGAGFDRKRLSSHSWGPMSGMCGLTMGDWRETEETFRNRSRQPHPIPFVAAKDPLHERESAVAVLSMLLPTASVESAKSLGAELLDLNRCCEPGGWLAAVDARGARGTLECFSIWPEVEMVLGGSGPFAIRLHAGEDTFTWAVLSSFDEKQNALVYDPCSKEPQPVRWSRDELEKRWFGAGGLAFACRR